MITVPAPLLAHYQGSTTSIADCIKLTLQNGTVLGFTSAMSDLTVSSVLYSGSGLRVSALVGSSDASVDNAEVNVLPADDVMRADLLTGVWDNAAWETFEVNYADVTMGIKPGKCGRFGNIQFRRGEFVVEARGLLQALQQPVGDVTSVLCRYRLGDARCTKDLTAFTYAGMVVLSGSTRILLNTSGWSFGDDWFTEGEITVTSGANSGYRRKVRSSVSGEITLNEALPYDIAPGDTFTAIAGCQKRHIEDCKDKFDNILFFGGEPHLPGLDQVTKAPVANV